MFLEKPPRILELKDAITESKAKSKGVSKLELKDELRKAALDEGLIISYNDEETVCSMLYQNN